MSIKEKAQQIIQRAEAEKTAELRRQEEGQRQWNAECQVRVRQYEALKAERFEKGKRALESTNVERILGEVLDMLREEDPEAQLQIREDFKYYPPGTDSRYMRNINRILGIDQEGKEKHKRNGQCVPIVAMVVEKVRGEGEVTTRLGVGLDVDDPGKLWVISAFGVGQQGDVLGINDKDLLPKLEERFAQKIASGLHRYFKPVSEDWGTSGGWTGASF